jgi:hypothetical protein
MAFDHSVTMIYVMWREERLWNVIVLHRVHLSNLEKGLRWHCMKLWVLLHLMKKQFIYAREEAFYLEDNPHRTSRSAVPNQRAPELFKLFTEKSHLRF